MLLHQICPAILIYFPVGMYEAEQPVYTICLKSDIDDLTMLITHTNYSPVKFVVLCISLFVIAISKMDYNVLFKNV